MRTLFLFSLLLTSGCDVPQEDLQPLAQNMTAIEMLEGPNFEVCLSAPSNPFAFEKAWEYIDTNGYGVVINPAIGQLTDDNGDGQIDRLDNPDLVFTSYFGDTLIAIHGDGSGVLFEKHGYWGRSGVSIGDIDRDGQNEIVAATTNYQVIALNADGSEKWTSTEQPALEAEVLIADLDMNGQNEVIVDGTVLEGETGNLLFRVADGPQRSVTAADIDDDGSLELILGGRVYSHDGYLEWSAQMEFNYLGEFTAVGNMDEDSGLETVFVAGEWENSRVFIHDDDGSLLHSFTTPAGNAGRPAVADFDGDGDFEVAISGIDFITVHDLDGAVIWQNQTEDEWGLRGTTAYDFDNDGVPELVSSDASSITIRDGADGALRYQNKQHLSPGYSHAVPQVVDVNRDGFAELIVASHDWPNSQNTGVTSYGVVLDEQVCPTTDDF